MFRPISSSLSHFLLSSFASHCIASHCYIGCIFYIKIKILHRFISFFDSHRSVILIISSIVSFINTIFATEITSTGFNFYNHRLLINEWKWRWLLHCIAATLFVLFASVNIESLILLIFVSFYSDCWSSFRKANDLWIHIGIKPAWVRISLNIFFLPFGLDIQFYLKSTWC